MTREQPFVYVVDDDPSAREGMVALARAAGFHALGFASAHHFLSHPREGSVGCLLLDVEMPEVGGLDLQRKLKTSNDPLPIIFVTGHGDIPTSVRAIKAGALDFMTKPLDGDALVDAIRLALAQRDGGGRHLTTASASDRGSIREELAGIVGVSAALEGLLDEVRTVAKTDSTVLIQGETGTGKERIARAVHELSGRSNGRFVKVNCAAIPSALLESELMGHERGAFTGAISQRIGRFELAQDGTIFLDEIGEMPLDLQPKLLRLLQEREFERLGSAKTVRTNARVVAATNRKLVEMVKNRTFREDLYYRLSVFPVEVPSLRDRKDDIPMLARHFVKESAERLGKRAHEISPEVLDCLVRHCWPGNIRELQNVLERAVILARNRELEVHDLSISAVHPRTAAIAPEPAKEADVSTNSAPHSDGLADVSRAHILRVLKETNWVIAGLNGAAARLEMKRSTLNFRMKKLGIARPARGLASKDPC